MTRASYDVVVVGDGLEGRLVTALVAKRGYRVLCVGHRTSPPDYEVAGRRFPFSIFRLDGVLGHPIESTLEELNLLQGVRRTLRTGVLLHAVLPKDRIDLHQDPARRLAEFERVFPVQRRTIDEFHAIAGEFDRRFEEVLDFGLTPHSFQEQRAVSKLCREAGLFDEDNPFEPLRDLPEHSEFVELVRAPARITSRLDPQQLTDPLVIRHYENLFKGSAELSLSEFLKLLSERQATLAGEIRSNESIAQIEIERGQVRGVQLSSGETLGTSILVHAADMKELSALIPERGLLTPLSADAQDVSVRYYRYVLHLVVREEAMPAPLVTGGFAIHDRGRPLVGENFIVFESATALPGERRLSLEVLLPRRAVEEIPGYVGSLRERVLASAERFLPFIEQHILFVDSPHDGRDPEDRTTGRMIQPSEPWFRGPQHMKPVFGSSQVGYQGAGGHDVALPVHGLFLANADVAPGFGVEASFLAARTAAREVFRHDRRDFMRGGFWKRLTKR